MNSTGDGHDVKQSNSTRRGNIVLFSEPRNQVMPKENARTRSGPYVNGYQHQRPDLLHKKTCKLKRALSCNNDP